MPAHCILAFAEICMLEKNKLSIRNENKISFQIAQICLKMLICLIFMMCLRLSVPIWRQQGKPCPSI